MSVQSIWINVNPPVDTVLTFHYKGIFSQPGDAKPSKHKHMWVGSYRRVRFDVGDGQRHLLIHPTLERVGQLNGARQWWQPKGCKQMKFCRCVLRIRERPTLTLKPNLPSWSGVIHISIKSPSPRAPCVDTSTQNQFICMHVDENTVIHSFRVDD